jgi:uncharacterized protein (PEP-CTERM system associated)
MPVTNWHAPCLARHPRACWSIASLAALGALSLALALPVHAQAPRSGASFSASIDSRLGFNINSRLGGRDDPWWTAEVTPGIRLQSRSGRVVGSLDYGLVLSTQTRGEDRSQVGNRLSASFSADVVDRRLFLEGRASITQQATNAFSTQYAPGSSSAAFDRDNRTEVANLSLSPVLRGVLGSAVNYEFRLTADATDSRESSTGDQVRTGGSVGLSSAIRGTRLTWSLNARSLETDYRLGRATRNDTAVATLGWIADADLSFSARGGTERQNIDSIQSRSTSTWGLGATWRPSPRTRFQLNVDDRFFGRGWNGVVEYRMKRSVFTLGTSRDSSDAAGSRFEPLSQFQVYMSLLAADIPDEVEREAAVLALLASQGVDPNEVVRPGFVTSAVSVAERNRVGWSWNGQRLSLSIQAYRASTRVIDAEVPELSRDPVRQSGYTSTASYRLTPRINVVVNGSRQMTDGRAGDRRTDLKSLSVSLTQRLGPRTTLSGSSRYSVFNSPVNPYREAAVQLALGHRF